MRRFFVLSIHNLFMNNPFPADGEMRSAYLMAPQMAAASGSDAHQALFFRGRQGYQGIPSFYIIIKPGMPKFNSGY